MAIVKVKDYMLLYNKEDRVLEKVKLNLINDLKENHIIKEDDVFEILDIEGFIPDEYQDEEDFDDEKMVEFILEISKKDKENGDFIFYITVNEDGRMISISY